jgi:hypothetical protein
VYTAPIVKECKAMIVNWTKNNVKVVPSNKLGRSFILLPGHNVIDEKDWKVLCEEAGLDKGHEAQFLKVVTEKVTGAEGKVKEAKEFKDFENTTAKNVITDMYNIKDLKELLKEETRSDVRYEIEKRIDELKTAKSNEKISKRDE